MGVTEELRAIWKKLGIKGHVKNLSSERIWVLDTELGTPVAHLLPPLTKSPAKVDADAFKRVDGKPIDGHSAWWKFYDFSNVEIFDDGSTIRTSVITKTAVEENHFGVARYDESKDWGVPIQLITDVRRNKKKRILKYYVTGSGWVTPTTALAMTCHGEIDNARPVFPKGGRPFIRTRRDQEFFNNLEMKG